MWVQDQLTSGGRFAVQDDQRLVVQNQQDVGEKIPQQRQPSCAHVRAHGLLPLAIQADLRDQSAVVRAW